MAGFANPNPADRAILSRRTLQKHTTRYHALHNPGKQSGGLITDDNRTGQKSDGDSTQPRAVRCMTFSLVPSESGTSTGETHEDLVSQHVRMPRRFERSAGTGRFFMTRLCRRMNPFAARWQWFISQVPASGPFSHAQSGSPSAGSLGTM